MQAASGQCASLRGAGSVAEWLTSKRRDDGAEGLWRVHDTLYDLTSFAHKHPGGAFWLVTTRGTDITEAVEVHVGQTKVKAILEKYAVRKATAKSTCTHTFKPDGFYATLRGRVFDTLRHDPPGPTQYTRLLADIPAAAFIVFAVLSAVFDSVVMAGMAGATLALLLGVAHNFFHQRNTFRMYYFDLSPLSSRYWRVSHALSHHFYPNGCVVKRADGYVCFYYIFHRHDTLLSTMSTIMLEEYPIFGPPLHISEGLPLACPPSISEESPLSCPPLDIREISAHLSTIVFKGNFRFLVHHCILEEFPLSCPPLHIKGTSAFLSTIAC